MSTTVTYRGDTIATVDNETRTLLTQDRWVEGNITLIDSSRGFDSETDPVFSASPAASITQSNITNWNNKSNFSGNYNDLTNKPTIPAAQVNADWDASSGVAQILNKPNLSLVARTGSYNDLTNKPTIPTSISDLTNDSDYISTETDPVFLNSPAGGITANDILAWNNKSDFSGSYNDLTNKPNLSTYMVKGADYVTAGKASNSTVGTKATAEGQNTVASGSYSHAEGQATTASALNSHAEGYHTQAIYNPNSHAQGYATISSGNGSHAEGNATTASGYAAHTEGEGTSASAQAAHAEGYQTEANGYYSHAEGKNTKATNEAAHAEGSGTISSGVAAHAEGNATTASGTHSHAEVYKTKATGNYSHAEGIETIASGYAAHTEGGFTQAKSQYSHAEGQSTIAEGNVSHAEGVGTIARGDFSHAEGCHTQAKYKCQHVFGEYNIVDNVSGTDTTERGTYVEIIGNGTDIWDETSQDYITTRSNARTLDWQGNQENAGDVIAYGCGGANPISMNQINTNLNKLLYSSSQDGTYTLQVTVTNGIPTYSWVVISNAQGGSF